VRRRRRRRRKWRMREGGVDLEELWGGIPFEFGAIGVDERW